MQRKFFYSILHELLIVHPLEKWPAWMNPYFGCSNNVCFGVFVFKAPCNNCFVWDVEDQRKDNVLVSSNEHFKTNWQSPSPQGGFGIRSSQNYFNNNVGSCSWNQMLHVFCFTFSTRFGVHFLLHLHFPFSKFWLMFPCESSWFGDDKFASCCEPKTNWNKIVFRQKFSPTNRQFLPKTSRILC